MEIARLLAYASLIVTLGGCGAGDPTATEPVQRGPSSVDAPVLNTYPTIDCPTGFHCQYADDQGGVEINRQLMRDNCNQEACGSEGITPRSQYVEVDGRPDGADILRGTCAATGLPFALASDSTLCWDCIDSCAAACPSGMCVTIPKSPGSDCRHFTCPAGYTMVPQTNAFIPPTCQKVDGAPSPSSPPSTSPLVHSTSTLDGNPHLAWNPSEGATSYVIYRQLEWMGAADSWAEVAGTSYTDNITTVSGPPGGWSTKWVAYHVVGKNSAGVSGPSQTFYWPYTGIAPY